MDPPQFFSCNCQSSLNMTLPISRWAWQPRVWEHKRRCFPRKNHFTSRWRVVRGKGALLLSASRDKWHVTFCHLSRKWRRRPVRPSSKRYVESFVSFLFFLLSISFFLFYFEQQRNEILDTCKRKTKPVMSLQLMHSKSYGALFVATKRYN